MSSNRIVIDESARKSGAWKCWLLSPIMAPLNIRVLMESTYFTVPEMYGPDMFEAFESVTCTPTIEIG